MDKGLIIFDLGGVLADLGNPPQAMRLDISEEDFWDLWLSSKSVRSFENGEIAEEEFLERFSGELDLDESKDDFRRRLTHWKLRIYPGVAAAISALRLEYDVALLSNTNPIHWNMVRNQDSFEQLFDHIFLSFEIGQSKPDAAVFEHVLGHVAQEPRIIRFFDDSAGNVVAAKKFKMKAFRFDGQNGIESVLQSAGIARPENQTSR